MKLVTFVKNAFKKIKEGISGKNAFLKMLKDMEFDDDDIRSMGYGKLLNEKGKITEQ